jgi:hypothetical protein
MSGIIIVTHGCFLPPCVEAVEVKTPAGFPSIAPESQRLAVESMSDFICAVMLP